MPRRPVDRADYVSALWRVAGGTGFVAAATVVASPGSVPLTAGGLALLLAAAARLRSPLLGAAVAATSLAALATLLPLAGSPYRTALLLDAGAAFLPPAAILLLRVAGHRARRRAGFAERVPLGIFALAAASAGTLIRIAEISLLWSQPGTIATVRYALHGDLAATFWTIAAFATAGAYLYAASAASPSPGRRLPRVVAAACLAVAVFSFVGYDVATAVAAAAHGPVALGIGLHTDDVRDLPDGTGLAHLDVAWDRVEKESGVRDWSYFDEQVRISEERGIGLYLLANSYPPAWLARARSDSVMVDQDGEPFLWVDERPGVARERVWDLSFHDAEVVALKQAFARAVVDRYAASPAVRWVAVQNEPAYPFDWNLVRYASYDNATLRAFGAHVEAKFGTIEALRENATEDWDSFDDLEAPRHPLAPLWSEWLRFREDALVDFVEGLVDAVRPFAAGKPVTVKIMAHVVTRFAEPQTGLADRVVRAFANGSDVVSVDLYPASVESLRRSLDYWSDVAAGKPLVIAEFNLLLGTNLPTGGARLVNALFAMDGRVDAVFLFTASDHWLYSLTAHARSPGLTALTLATTSPLSPDYGVALTALLVEDLLSVQNTYHVYALGMTAAGLPVVPWPILLLVSAPVPSGDGRARWGLLLGKGIVFVAALAFLL